MSLFDGITAVGLIVLGLLVGFGFYVAGPRQPKKIKQPNRAKQDRQGHVHYYRNGKEIDMGDDQLTQAEQQQYRRSRKLSARAAPVAGIGLAMVLAAMACLQLPLENNDTAALLVIFLACGGLVLLAVGGIGLVWPEAWR